MLTLSTDSLTGYGLNRIFEFAKELDFDGIDLSIQKDDFDTQNADYIRELIEAYKLPVIALQTPQNATHQDIINAAEMSKKIGNRIVIIQPPKITNFKQIQWLKTKVPKLRKKANISIALENSTPKTILGLIPKHAMNNINDLRKFKHVCLDTTRLHSKKLDLIRTYNFLKDYIVHIHLSNVYSRRHYYLPTNGSLPLESLLSKLKQDNFKGAISLRIKPKYLEAGDDQKVIEHLKACKNFYEKFFVKQ